MVSVGIAALGRTDLHFVDPGVKINDKYYQDVFLARDLQSDIRQHSDDFIFTRVSYAEARNRYRLDVRNSTRWYCIKTAEHIVMLS